MELASEEIKERQSSPNKVFGKKLYGVIGNTYNTPSKEVALGELG